MLRNGHPSHIVFRMCLLYDTGCKWHTQTHISFVVHINIQSHLHSVTQLVGTLAHAHTNTHSTKEYLLGITEWKCIHNSPTVNGWHSKRWHPNITNFIAFDSTNAQTLRHDYNQHMNSSKSILFKFRTDRLIIRIAFHVMDEFLFIDFFLFSLSLSASLPLSFLCFYCGDVPNISRYLPMYSQTSTSMLTFSAMNFRVFLHTSATCFRRVCVCHNSTTNLSRSASLCNSHVRVDYNFLLAFIVLSIRSRLLRFPSIPVEYAFNGYYIYISDERERLSRPFCAGHLDYMEIC